VLCVSWAVVENLSLFEHVRQKSLYYVGFKSLVKSLKSTSSQRFLKGFRLIADGGEHLIHSGPGESVDQLGENMAEIASQTRRLIHGVC